MEYALLGWADDGIRLRLDHERFPYAGKFRTARTGKAVAREERHGEGGDTERGGGDGGDRGEESPDVDVIVAAAAFNDDRAADALRIRYVSVRRDRQGEGIGPRLLAFVGERALAAGYPAVRIGVNNPFSYQACYKAGFGDTGERTGLAELVLERPAERDPATYRAGLAVFAERNLSDAERSFVEARRDAAPPATVPVPGGVTEAETETGPDADADPAADG